VARQLGAHACGARHGKRTLVPSTRALERGVVFAANDRDPYLRLHGFCMGADDATGTCDLGAALEHALSAATHHNCWRLD